MEYVYGVPITDYCDARRLTTRQRLELFSSVCEAVQHAHQKGIIHRDIKASNVLVVEREQGGTPQAKVIDFGVAKATEQTPLTERTLYTEHGLMVGTPEYMSPEQAGLGVKGGAGIDIDTRADVYALGVLLYELLTGALPFDRRTLRDSSYEEIRRIIREVDPPRPSTKLAKLGEDSWREVAKHRGTAPQALRRTLRGDLDWIVMRAMEKDRERRYGSAADLAADLARHLRDEPVLAGPPTGAYRASKFLKRHWRGVAASAAMVLLLIAGIIATGWQAVRATRAEHAIRAEQNRTLEQTRLAVEQRALAESRALEARREATRASLVSRFLERTLASADPYENNDDPRVSEVFDQAVRQVESGGHGTDPEIEATLRTVIGRLSVRINRADVGIAHLEKALEYRRRQQPPDPRELARTLNLIGSACSDHAQYDRAEPLLAEAMALARQLDDVALAAVVRFNQAVSLLQQRRFADAVPPLESLVEHYRVARQARAATMPTAQLPAGASGAAETGYDDEDPTERLASVLEALASAHLQLGAHERAISAAREAISLRRALAANANAPAASQPAANTIEDMKLIESMAVLAQALGIAGQREPSIEIAQEGLQLLRKRQRRVEGSETMFREIMATNYAALGERRQAIELLERVVESRLRLDGPRHPRVARALADLGMQLYREGRALEAKARWRQAWDVLSDVRDQDGPGVHDKAVLAGMLGVVSTHEDSPSNTELFEFALSVFRKDAQPRAVYTNALMNYWLACYRDGRQEMALRLAEELLPASRKVYDPASFDLSQGLVALSRSLLRTAGDAERAEALAREALDIRSRLSPPDSSAVQAVHLLIGESLLRRNRIDEARPIVRTSALSLLSSEHGSSTDYIRRDALRLLDELGLPRPTAPTTRGQ
jgi:tetratricopeptide (TPR) repeat protein